MKKYTTLLLLFSFFFASAQQDYETLKKLMLTNPDSTVRLIDQLQPLVKDQDSSIRYEIIKTKALVYLNKLELAEQLADSIVTTTNNDFLKLEANYIKGAFFFYAGQFNEGLAFYKTLFREANQLKDTAMVGKISANLSANFIRQNKYDSALVYLEYSLAIDIANNDSNYIASDYNFFGTCYNKLKLYDQAKEELFKALRYKPDPITKANTFYNIAMSNLKLLELDSAIYYAKLSQDLYTAYNNEYSLIRVYSLIGVIWQGAQEYSNAILYHEKTVELAEKRGDERALSIAYNNLSVCYLGENNATKAVQYAILAFEINSKNQNIEFATNSSENLALAYALQGKVDSTIKYIDVSDSLREKFLQNSYYDKLSSVQGKLQLAEKETELAKNELELEKKEAALANYKFQVIIIIASIVLVLLIILLLFIQFKNKQKQQFQAAIIQEKQAGLNREIDASENERKRISKELHDGIGQELSALKMNLGSLLNELPEDAPSIENKLKTITNQLSESADEVRNISHRMMPRALIDGNLQDAINDLFVKTFQYSEIDYKFEHSNFTYKLPKTLEISFYRILQELVNNIIKHSKAKTIEVQLYETSKSVILHVEDDGVGSKNINSSGHGMFNIKNRVEMFKGKVNIDSEVNRGTSVTVSVPK